MNHAYPSKKLCTWIWAVLVAMHFMILGIAQVNLGLANTPLILVLAIVQTALVASYYMGVKHGTKLVCLFAVAGVFWLAVQWTLTFSDYLTRAWH